MKIYDANVTDVSRLKQLISEANQWVHLTIPMIVFEAIAILFTTWFLPDYTFMGKYWPCIALAICVTLMISWSVAELRHKIFGMFDRGILIELDPSGESMSKNFTQHSRELMFDENGDEIRDPLLLRYGWKKVRVLSISQMLEKLSFTELIAVNLAFGMKQRTLLNTMILMPVKGSVFVFDNEESPVKIADKIAITNDCELSCLKREDLVAMVSDDKSDIASNYNVTLLAMILSFVYGQNILGIALCLIFIPCAVNFVHRTEFFPKVRKQLTRA